MTNSLSTNNNSNNEALIEEEPAFNLTYLYLNTKSEHYNHLKGYMEDNTVVVTSHRELPSIMKVYYSDNSGYGCFYAYRTLEEFGERWSKLDVRLIKPITNDEILKVLKQKVNIVESLTLEEALLEVGGDISQLIQAFELPVAYYD
ncbi:hypothetical protein P4679_25635 [Priestia megaterium]|uniref:hypothetical protein n=1 Tax=Priestia megaterium TaxID=1404 RepID=UPI002E245C9A|nr:hypothetical protein [Priestia megaterium]